MQQFPPAYTRTAIGLHWIIFLLIACAWPLGQFMARLPFSPQKPRFIAWHKWIGVTVVMLALVRLAGRLAQRDAPKR